MGASNWAPPQLKVFLVDHHFPWLLFGPRLFIPFHLRLRFWRVVANSRALEHTWHCLQLFHLINGSGMERNRHCKGAGVKSKKWSAHTDLHKNSTGCWAWVWLSVRRRQVYLAGVKLCPASNQVSPQLTENIPKIVENQISKKKIRKRLVNAFLFLKI